MNKILIREYHDKGEFSNWGTEVIVNDKLIGTYTDVDKDVVSDLLRALDVKFDLEYIYDDQD
ncbi:hypothetical protein P5G61_05890 [Paenibacillus sp. F6_3S_P_1C]|uniref:Uncharacterized protein n=1 Tax=Paenibacillus vandeheii TaxID=3035917 RepID=A0ABT8J946_9BACL|nr:hypothetical protein [Paenibacillus vandeheii]MDN4600749.1 hypothetical protein [Paenibacillus vandeheii]